MKRLTILLGGLGLALPLALAPSAAADHLTYPRTFTVYDIWSSTGSYGENYRGTYEGQGDYGFTFWVKTKTQQVGSLEISQNKSWTTTGYNRMAYIGNPANNVWYHINTSFDPPCGDGDTGTVSIRYRITYSLGDTTDFFKIVDPIDCT